MDPWKGPRSPPRQSHRASALVVAYFSMPNGQAFSEPFIAAFATLTGREKEEAEEAAFPLLEGAGNMLTRLVDRLYALAQAAKGTAAEALLISGGPEIINR